MKKFFSATKFICGFVGFVMLFLQLQESTKILQILCWYGGAMLLIAAAFVSNYLEDLCKSSK